MAFSADELRVLRCALANVAHPTLVPGHEVRACLRLALAVDLVAGETTRERSFLAADLRRYRAALPGTATGYLKLLAEALGGGYRPTADDLAALRRLYVEPGGPRDQARNVLRLLREARERSAVTPVEQPPPAALTDLVAARRLDGDGPQPGSRFTSSGEGDERRPAAPEEPRPARRPTRPAPASPRPARPVPTPGEVFPPRRRPKPRAEGRVPAALLA